MTRVKELIESTVKELGGGQVAYDPEIAKVSIVGLGMRSHAGVAAKTFGILAGEGINIMGISTSEIKISCIIACEVHGAGGARAARRVRARESALRGRCCSRFGGLSVIRPQLSVGESEREQLTAASSLL